ncbi:MAG: amidohydrolase family protein [Hyphomicrobiales bacterium]
MSDRRLIIHGAALIDGSGAQPISDSTIVVDGERITYAGRRTIEYDRPGASSRNAEGKTIIPGLIEAHTHAAFDADMRCYLKNGITSIRFAGLNQDHVAQLSARITAGEVTGPHILSCGPMIDQAPPAYPEWSVTVSNTAEATDLADRLIAKYDLDALIVTQRVTAPVMGAIIDASHARGCPVVGQIWAIDGEEAAELGIDELHTSSRVYRSRAYPAERLVNYSSIPERLALTSRAWASLDWDLTLPIMGRMVEKQVKYCGMQVITQYQTGEGVDFLENDGDFLSLFGEDERLAFHEFTRRLQGGWSSEDLDYARRANDKRMEWMRRFRELGGVLLAGTDMQFGGIMLHRELLNLEKIGLSRLEVIATATSVNATALGIEAVAGIIRPGFRADVVVLNRDPLSDISALRDIDLVVKAGNIVVDGGVFTETKRALQ